MKPVPDSNPALAGPLAGEFARHCAELRAEIHAAAAALDEAVPPLLAGFRAVTAAVANDAEQRRRIERLVVALQFHDVLAQGLGRMQGCLDRLEGLGAGGAGGETDAPRLRRAGEVELF